jgi:hypothetical protein
MGAEGGDSHTVGIRDIDAVGAFGSGLSSLLVRTGRSTFQVRY